MSKLAMNRPKLEELHKIIDNAFEEDIREGDHSALACIPEDATGRAKLLVKEPCTLAGIDLAEIICKRYDASLVFKKQMEDGDLAKVGDIAFTIEGSSRSLLSTERLMLNCMQRMSAISSETKKYTELVKQHKAKILDTRKTTPGIRILEKWAVLIGGGHNHRMGLYDMIMLKDNHIDFCGSIERAIEKTYQYLEENQLIIPIEVEARNLREVEEILAAKPVQRIMLDNFNYEDTKKAVALIDGRAETESSGGINLNTVAQYAACGVDFISVGAITHGVKNVDLSLKAW